MAQRTSLQRHAPAVRCVAITFVNTLAVAFCALLVIRLAMQDSMRSFITYFMGDGAIFVNVHEFIKRGHVLYRDVWDHKDAGFFVLSHPFFARMGLEGLYVFGLAFVLIFAAGVFFAVRSISNTLVASIIAALATIAYISTQSFYPSYTEHPSISLAVLGAGVAASYPLVAGFALILSCTVKVSGVIIYACVACLYVVRALFYRSSSPVAKRNLVLFAIGSLVGVLSFAAISNGIVSWRDWLEVVAFNREYAERRSSPLKASDFINLFDKSCPRQILLTLYALIASVVLLGAFSTSKALHTRAEKNIPASLFSLACVVGAYIAQMLQYPPVPHNWQYLAGAITFSTAICLTACFVRLPAKYLCVGVFIVCGLYLAQQWRLILPTSFDTGWAEIASAFKTRAALSNTTSLLPPNSTIAIFGGNQERVEFQDSPASLSLSCRFFYQFELFAPRFSDDINNCLNRRPRFVFLNTSHTPDVSFAARARLKAEYVDCEVVDRNFKIFSADADSCASLRHDNSSHVPQ